MLALYGVDMQDIDNKEGALPAGTVLKEVDPGDAGLIA